MKFIQITDTHLVPPGKQLHGLDPRARLDACVADINAHHADAEFCVITGDLVHAGQPEAYEDLRECLAALDMPYHLLIGNHDNRQNFREAFPETPCDENGFVQSVLETDAGPFILLDTVLEAAGKGEHWGAFCDRRANWLRSRLDEFAGQPVYVFMHHPSFELALPSMDNLKIREPNALEAALRDADNVRHLFFGHIHRPISGSWQGIPFSTLRSTNHQVAFDFGTVSPVPKSHEPPAYGVVFLTEESVVVHTHDFLDNSALAVPADARKVA
ncbi:MAG: phosphodiesterase [Magnetovibrio sp.]|nr:phosphodiesterase [Magnetovibrio sp.]